MYKRILENLINYRMKHILDKKGNHRHHIVPRYMGGDDSEENIIVLTYREHKIIHFLMWKIFGNWQDKCAYSCFAAMSNEAFQIIVSEAGKIGGKITKDNNLGIFDPEYDRGYQSKLNIKNNVAGFNIFSAERKTQIGKMGGNTTKDNNLGIFDPKYKHLLKEWATINGKIGGLKAKKEQLGYLNPIYENERKQWCSEGGKKGGKIVGSMYWWTNGIENKKSFENPGKGWKRGMTKKGKDK